MTRTRGTAKRAAARGGAAQTERGGATKKARDGATQTTRDGGAAKARDDAAATTREAARGASPARVAAPSPARVVSPSLALVVVNPTSAGGATGRAWPRLAATLREQFGAFEVAFTARAGDATVIAEREARAGRRFIVACGGDGTVSEVAGGILASGAPAELGLLPSGTGGDFRRTLRVPRRDADAAAALRTGRTVTIDAGRVEYLNPRGEAESRFFVNVASCGMGGEVIRRVKESGGGWLPARAGRLLGGRAAFAAASVRAAFAFERPRLRVRLDGGPERTLALTTLCVANARYFGGGMKIAPTAELNDGLLDAVAVSDMGTLSILANSYRLYLGTHLGMSEVSHARARELSVRAERDGARVLLEVDGELVGTPPATFRVLPRALRVRVVNSY